MFGMEMKDMKAGFFDRAPIIQAVDKATRQVLSKFGAFVRTAARSSIRKRKRISDPNQPPSSHMGLLKQFIYFAYEPGSQNVVIGPVRLGSKSGEAPASLEYGGPNTVTTVRRGKKTTNRVQIAARPFMHPAFEQEKAKLPALWANSVRN